jgi:hypothetical protein
MFLSLIMPLLACQSGEVEVIVEHDPIGRISGVVTNEEGQGTTLLRVCRLQTTFLSSLALLELRRLIVRLTFTDGRRLLLTLFL